MTVEMAMTPMTTPATTPPMAPLGSSSRPGPYTQQYSETDRQGVGTDARDCFDWPTLAIWHNNTAFFPSIRWSEINTWNDPVG
jgi:hypothetical protein